MAAIALVATLALAASARALDGFPDASFGGDGIVTTPAAPDSGTELANAVAIQLDGKIVVAGFADNNPTASNNFDFVLARYNSDGSLDTGFDGNPGNPGGGNGIVGTDVSSPANDADRIFAVAIQPSDGKIVVAGDSQDAGSEDFTLARYNTDGTLDSNTDADPGTAFGTNGIVTTSVSPAMVDDGARSVAIQADGKVVAAGNAGFGGSTDNDFALVRYNADGTLDTGFDGDAGNPGGGNGIVGTDFSGDGNFDEAGAVAIQSSDGKIVAAGTADVSLTNTDLALARYDSADGKLDTGFDGPGGTGDGKFLTGFGVDAEDLNALVIQPSDGKIVTAGSAAVGGANQFALARFLPADGSLDSGFDGDPGNLGGGNGKVTTNFVTGTSRANGVTVAPDGKLVAAGAADSDPTAAANTDFAAARYHAANGTLDTAFAGDGTVTTTVAPVLNTDSASEAVVQSDGKVVAIGSADFGSGLTGFDFTLVRWAPEPPPPIITPPVTTPGFDLAAAKRKCKKKFPPGKKRKKCIKKAKKKAAQA